MRALRTLFLGGGASIGVVLPFIAVILLDRGFDLVGVGIVTALFAAAFTASVPVWGHLADVVLGRSRALQVAAIAAGLALGLTLLPLPPLAVAACFIAFGATESAFAPLADALAVNAVPDPRRDYARVRIMASLSFAVATIAAGFVYDQTGYEPAPILFALAVIVVIASAAFVPDVARADLRVLTPDDEPAERPTSGRSPTWRMGSAGAAFRLAPRLPLVLLAIGLIYVGIQAGLTYLPIRLTQLGAEPSAIALSAGVSAFAEIPAFLVMGVLVQRFGLRAVFAASAVLYAVCFAAWIVLDSPFLIVATRIATGIGFAGLGVVAVLTIGVLLPARLQGTGQALYQTTAFGLAAIVANIVGGVLYSQWGHAAVFATSLVLAILAALVGTLALPRELTRLDKTTRPV